MNVRTTHLFQAVHDAVVTSGGSRTFTEILPGVGDVSDPFTLAQLIEVDGRTRIMIEAPVDLADYLRASPMTAADRVALDAAIDMTLKSLRRRHGAGSKPVDALIRDFPEHGTAIRDADMIDAVLCSTETMVRGRSRYRDALPCDFGPNLEDGRPRYQLTKFLGSGAYGEVYLAEDRRFSDDETTATVAIKVMHALHINDAARREFLDEATKARRIQHPNVVRVLDRGITRDGSDFIVYEYIDSERSSLEDISRDWSVRDTAQFVARLASAVQAIHSRGLIHCDIKPGNVLVGPNGEPRITDFGVAVRSSTARQQVSGYDAGKPIGTIGFMPPEQYRGEEGALRPASDIYAVGGILYWLLTGQVPNGSTGAEIEENLAGDNPRSSPPELGRQFPKSLQYICSKAMNPDPEERYAAAAMMAADLASFLDRRPIPGMHTSVPRRIGLSARRNPGAAVLFVIALAACGIGGWQAKVAYDEMQLKRALSGTFEYLSSKMAHRSETGFDAQVLTTIWTWEWYIGPQFIDSRPYHTILWDQRIDTVRTCIERNTESGASDQLDTFFLQMAYAFWLTHGDEFIWTSAEGESENIEAGLTHLESTWTPRLPPGDPWIERIGLFRDRAMINRMLAQPESVSEPDLEAAVARLEEIAARDLKSASDAMQLTLYARRSLIRAYGKDLLDRPADQERHEEIEKRVYVDPAFFHDDPGRYRSTK